MEAAEVYWAVSDTREWARLLAAHDVLDDAERTRAERFAFAADRDAFVAAHALLRLALSMHGDSAPHDWRFATEPSGRPELAGTQAGTGLTFSISHARTIVACAIGRGGSVGVDVEAIVSGTPEAALVRSACTPAERALLAAVDPAKRAVAFTRLWTLKEAVLKAAGDGTLDAIECALDPPRLVRGPVTGSAPATWELTSLQPTVRHVLALAHDPRER